MDERMGRKNTIAIQNIGNLYKYNSLDIKGLKINTEFLLALYRDICWQIINKSNECENKVASFCSSDVDLGLMYLYEFGSNHCCLVKMAFFSMP